MTYSATLTRGNVKTILKALKHNRWSVAPLGARHGYAAKPPSGIGTVRFSQSSPRKQVVQDFNDFGLPLELGPQYSSRTPETNKVSSAFGSLVPLVEASQKPLIDIPESVLRCWEFSTHALERLAERNIGYFEALCTLYRPDSTRAVEGEDPDNLHFFRGDIEVVASTRTRSVLTVIDVLQYHRSTPRVALAPEVTRSVETPAPPEENPVAKKNEPKPFDFESYDNKSRAVREWFATIPNGTVFDRAFMRNALPGEPNSTDSENWLGLADQVLARCYRLGSMRKVTMGTYEMLDAEAVTSMVMAKKATPLTGLAKSLAVRRGEIPSSYSIIRAAVDAAEPGAQFTSGSVIADLPELDCTGATANATLRKLHNEGRLSLIGNGSAGTHIYRKPLPESDKMPRPRKAQSSTRDADLTRFDPDPEDTVAFTAKPSAVRSTRAKTLPSRTTVPEEPEDYDVHVGFQFVAELPKSDVFDLVDVVEQHRADLEATPWGWAQIATYSGGRATETASKRASKLEADLNDPLLKFEVRRVSTTEVGLFVARAPSTGGRVAHT